MPKGPKGEKRPADVVGAAVKVAKIATGEVEEDIGEDGKNKAAQALGRLGGAARAKKLNQRQRKKIAIRAAKARWRRPMEWRKVLTRSDAQQETRGSRMPFRFTRGELSEDYTTWFREQFFSSADWQSEVTNRGRHIETAEIPIQVTIEGEDLGVRKMRLNYDPLRPENNRAPTLHLLWDNKTRQKLESKNLTGREAVFRSHDGQYSLEIQ